MSEYPYVYKPVGFDRWDPIVIRGEPIKPGARVRITKGAVDPRKLFVWVEDEEGNEQSVYRKSLKRAR